MALATGSTGTPLATNKLPSSSTGATQLASTNRGVDSYIGSTSASGDAARTPDPTGDTGAGYGTPWPTTGGAPGDVSGGYTPDPTIAATPTAPATSYPTSQYTQAQLDDYYAKLMGGATAQTTGQNSLYEMQQTFANEQAEWAKAQALEQYKYENQINNQNFYRAGLDVDRNTLDRERLNNQMGLYNQQGTTGEQRYGTNLSALDQSYSTNIDYLMQQYGFNTREFANAKAQLDLQYGAARRQAVSQGVSSGGLSSSGFGKGLGEIAQQRDIGTAGAQIGLEANQAALQNKYNTSSIDYTANRANLGYDYEDFKNQLTNNKQNVDTALKQNALVGQQLQSIAADLGLNAEHMNAMFEYGLQKIGLDAGQTVLQLSNMMASNNENLKAQAAALIAQIVGIQ